MVAGEGFEPPSLAYETKLEPTPVYPALKMVGAVRLELTTYRLKAGCSEPTELRPIKLFWCEGRESNSRIQGSQPCALTNIGHLHHSVFLKMVLGSGFEPET